MVEWTGIVHKKKKIWPTWFSRIKVADGKRSSVVSDPQKDKEECKSGTTASQVGGPRPSWTPLRNIDREALNDSDRKSDDVQIEGGRATAHVKQRLITFNFYNLGDRELISSTWFIAPNGEKGPKSSLVPISEKECNKVEALYQTAVSAFDSGEDSVQEEVLKHEVDLEGPNGSPGFTVYVSLNKSTNKVSIRRRPKSKHSLFSLGGDNSVLLQRGYGEYVVEGEKEEVALGPVRQLVFVVHGIGEAVWSRPDVKSNSIVDEVNHVRAMMHKRQVEMWKRECEKAEQQGSAGPSPPNRIELLPIVWYDKIHSSTGQLKNTLEATTLKSIPALRSIANDVIFDVLMYMTPEFCQQVLTCVAEQIQSLFQKFQDCHPFFVSHGGKCSLVGHSLGSVILWDMLSILKRHEDDGLRTKLMKNTVSSVAGSFLDGMCVSNFSPSPPDLLSSEDNTYMPTLKRPVDIVLPFRPDSVFFLGSPLGLFLTLRGANTVFDALRKRKKPSEASDTDMSSGSSKADEAARQEIQLKTEANAPARKFIAETDVSPFSLPCGGLYNIFNPSDPVAYRIEPLLVSPDARNCIPPPVYLSTREAGIRPHVALKQLGDDLHKSLADGSASVTNMLFTAGTSIRRSLFDASTSSNGSSPSRRSSAAKTESGEVSFPLGGKSTRVDYQLQWGMIDNEYLSAVSAHSTYFRNADVIDFVIETVMDPTGTSQSFTLRTDAT